MPDETIEHGLDAAPCIAAALPVRPLGYLAETPGLAVADANDTSVDGCGSIPALLLCVVML
jgi:hypothetical protein